MIVAMIAMPLGALMSAAKVISQGATHNTTTTVPAKNATCLSAINPSC